MNIRFEMIEARNFMSFRSLDLELTQFEKQTVLISGKNEDIRSADYQVTNGSGKTTILNTILFAVYGETLKPLKSKMIANWRCSPKDDVDVALTITSGGNRYTIKRSLKGKARNGELHVFRENGGEYEEITLSTMAETQRMIETEIVPCGKDGFLRCIILTADQEYNFFRLSKSDKNAFFESLFELTTYTEMYELVHRKTLDASSELTTESRLIDTLNDNISKLKSEQERSASAASEVVDAEKELAAKKLELAEFEESNQTVEELTCECDAMFDLKRKEFVASMKEKLSEFDAERGVVSVDKSGHITVDTSAEDAEMRAAADKFDSENGLDGIVGENGEVDVCKCEEYASAKTAVDALKVRLEKGNVALSELKSAISEKKAVLSDSNVNVSTLRERLSSTNAAIAKGESVSEMLCEDCKGRYDERFAISELKDKAKSISSEICDLEKAIVDVSDVIAKLTADEKRYEEGIEAIGAKISDGESSMCSIAERYSKISLKRARTLNEISFGFKSKKLEIERERSEFRQSLANEYNELVKKMTSENERKVKELSDRLFDLRENVKLAQCRYDALVSAKKSGFDQPIASLEEKLEASKRKFDALSCDIAHCKSLEYVLKPENLRKSVVPDMLKELNFRINGYLSKMGSNYSVEFDSDFDATFTSASGIETSYNNFSAGESMRLSIACCLAFKDFMQLRLDIRSNLLMIDEYIDSNLDQMAVNEIMDFIHYMVGSENVAAMIISHRTEVKENSFDSEILVVKKDDESHVEITNCKT